MMMAPLAIGCSPSAQSAGKRSLSPLQAPNKGGKSPVSHEVDESTEVRDADDAVGDRRGWVALAVPLGPPHVDGAHAHGRRALDVGSPRVTDEDDVAWVFDARLLERVLEDSRVRLAGTRLGRRR